MASLADQIDYLNALYIGPHGHGKTTAMARMAHLGKIVYVDYESGLKAGPLQRLGVPLEKIEVQRPKTYEQMEDLYWAVKGNLDDYEPGDPERIVGMVFDSYTELQAMLVKASVMKRVNKELRKTETAQKDTLKDQFFTAQDDYGYWTNQARHLTRMFRDLECHIAFGTLQRRDDDGHLVPDLTEKIRNDIMGYVDMIAHMVITESPYVDNPDRIEYLGIMRGINQYSGKDRFGVTPVVLANPSFNRLVHLMNERLDLSTDPEQLAYDRRMAERVAQAEEKNEE